MQGNFEGANVVGIRPPQALEYATPPWSWPGSRADLTKLDDDGVALVGGGVAWRRVPVGVVHPVGMADVIRGMMWL